MATKKEIVCYETDASRLIGKAEKVVFPKNAEEVSKIVSSNSNIVPRGAGSGFVGGCIPNNSVVADMGNMNKVSNFDPVKRSVYAEAGISVKELNEKLNAIGFEFPIDVSNSGISTIGGMIATNASGNRSMKYGTMKDWVEEVEFVNGRGELMKIGKGDLMDVCGMEGITGIITKARLKIIPLIKRSASIFQTDNLDEILSFSRRLKLEKEVVMLEFFSMEVSRLLGLPEKYHLIIEFDSDRGKIKGKEYEHILSLKNRVYYALASEGYYNSEDPKFFFDKIKEFILFLEENKIPYFGHLGTGVIHPFFKDDKKIKREEVIDFIKKTNTKPSNYGFGLTRKHYLDSFESKIIRRVKLRHDPFGKLNKNKVIDFEGDRSVFDIGESKKVRVKALVGEEKSAIEILEELKTPEEKLNEFIEEVAEKEVEEVKIENLEIKKPVEKEDIIVIGKEDIKSISDEEIKKRIEDYKYTYDSELPEKRMKVIESFAKEIPRNIVLEKAEIKKPEEFKKPEKSEKPDVDYKKIQDIMTNKYGFDDKYKFDDKKDEEIKKPEEKVLKISDDEKDLINKIMTNKYKNEQKK